MCHDPPHFNTDLHDAVGLPVALGCLLQVDKLLGGGSLSRGDSCPLLKQLCLYGLGHIQLLGCIRKQLCLCLSHRRQLCQPALGHQ